MIIIKYESGEDVEMDSISNANIEGFCFHRALLNDTDMSSSNFSKSDFRNAILDRSDLSNSVLKNASLVNSSLKDSILFKADLSFANASFADFSRANLAESILDRVDVFGSTFESANLCGARVICERIDDAIFEGALYNLSTRWPENFNPLKKGALLVK